jgi:type I restriction enzyme R subunit
VAISVKKQRELIQKFIDENMPFIKDGDNIDDEFEKF